METPSGLSTMPSALIREFILGEGVVPQPKQKSEGGSSCKIRGAKNNGLVFEASPAIMLLK